MKIAVSGMLPDTEMQESKNKKGRIIFSLFYKCFPSLILDMPDSRLPAAGRLPRE
jgi:hypothetical protein